MAGEQAAGKRDGVFIGLGANLPSRVGEPALTLVAALEALGGQGATVIRQSSLYASLAWPNPSDPPFVNLVAEVATVLPPLELLVVVKALELHFGRMNGPRNAPRPLDIDILDYRGLVLDMPDFALPHRGLVERAFVLVPLAEIAPLWRHPVSGLGVKELFSALGRESLGQIRRIS